MRKRWMMAAACLTAVSMMMAACGGSAASQPAQPAPTEAAPAETGAAEPASAAEESKAEETAAEETIAAEQGAGAALPEITRQGFLPAEDEAAPEVKAEIQDYTVDADLGNVSNIGDYYFEDDAKKMLAENGFFVSQYGSYEFWEPYESNRYAIMPNFVTVDSMMHTYHLYFSMLQKQTEKNFLAERLKKLSAAMLEKSEAQVKALAGTEWEDAAKRNVAFFAVGARLLDPSAKTPEEVEDVVKEELARIEAHSEILESGLTGDNEDYTQYIVRGYYEGDEQLEPYFRAMMWFGRLNFKQSEEDLEGQLTILESCISKGYKGIGIAPLSSVNVLPGIGEATEKGITIVDIDEKFDEQELENQGGATVAYVATDNVAVGNKGGQFIVDNVDEGAQVAIIEGKSGNQSSEDRAEGARKAFEDAGLDIIGSQAADWDRQTALDIATTYIQQNPDLSYIYEELLHGRAHELLHIHYPAHGQH